MGGGINEPAFASRISVGDWKVEADLGRIHRGDHVAVLEPRVMDLLMYLASRAGQVVSTDELAEQVWSGRAVTDQPVYQGIAQLRKALDDDARHPRYIATIPKKGYQLIAAVSRGEAGDVRVGALPPARRHSRLRQQVLSLLLAGTYLFLSSSDVSVSRIIASSTALQFSSIAVLPFVDMSEDGSHQYLGDGLAEEVIHRLAVAPELRVVGRTSSFSFRGDQTDLQSIGRRLGADVILEGSVRRSGDRLRITAQLVSVSDGYHVWSRTFEPAISDTFDIQDQIAQSIAKFLQTGLKDDSFPARSWTQSASAAEAYYLGLHQMRKRRSDSLDQALAHFRDAIAHDPQFALAYAALAKASFLASDRRYGRVPDAQAMNDMRESARIAHALDDSLAEVHVVRSMLETDVERSRPMILRAIEISPNHAAAYHSYGNVLLGLGRLEDSLEAREKAVALDPLAPVYRTNLAWLYGRLNRLADAESQLRTAIEVDPGWHLPYFGLLQVHAARGELARAIEAGKIAMSIDGPDARWAGSAGVLVGYTYLTLGEYDSAGRWFDRSEERDGDRWGLANNRIHLLLAQDRYGDADRLLSQWQAAKPESWQLSALGGLYRAVMAQDTDAIEMLEHAESLPSAGRSSNVFVWDYLSWGYVPAVNLAHLYLANEREARAEQLLEQSEVFIATFEHEGPGSPGIDYVRASIYALRGDDQSALETLRFAVDSGWSKLWFVERDPIMARYRDDPRFEEILDSLRQRLVRERELVAAAETG